MKSVISTGLVAALVLPSCVVAGSCPKYARGSNRVTCFAFVDESEVTPKEKGHHKRGHKKEIETTRTVNAYSWSFFWNYIIADDCEKTHAKLTSLLPPLGKLPHGVKCKVEVRWTPNDCGSDDQCHGQQHGNASWDYVGRGKISPLSLPARMEWPLVATYDRPEQYSKSHELGVKYEKANSGDMFRLDVSLLSVCISPQVMTDNLPDPQWQGQRFLALLGPASSRSGLRGD